LRRHAGGAIARHSTENAIVPMREVEADAFARGACSIRMSGPVDRPLEE
jgi:hypothetical protein